MASGGKGVKFGRSGSSKISGSADKPASGKGMFGRAGSSITLGQAAARSGSAGARPRGASESPGMMGLDEYPKMTASQSAVMFASESTPAQNQPRVKSKSKREELRTQKMEKVINDITGDNYFLGTGEHGSKKMAASKSYKKTVVIKMPVVIASPYGKLWSVDVIALYHNALKKELQDMYGIVEAMYKFQINLGFEDIERFYTWWEVFEGFIIDYFDIEEHVLFPYISERVPLGNTKLSKTERTTLKGRMTRTLREIDDMEDSFMNRPPGEMLPRFVEFLDQFSPRLLGYFHLEETIVPNVLQRNFEVQDRGRIQSRVFDFLKNRKYASETLVLQSRWLNAEHLKIWKAETLKGTARVSYNMWRMKLEKTHQMIVHEFKQRAVEDELEALQA
mmetsp:Transcript_15436/g.41434  ORF Transcript_15436/g.41434 Transcript_15436/m.41434 type:complete len:392 (-) Transcript_15436:505-1680(-)